MKILENMQGKRCSEEEYLKYTHKYCSKCEKVKVVNLFYRKKTQTSRGWAWDVYCIECRRSDCQNYSVSNRAKRNARLRKWRKDNPLLAKKKDRRAALKTKYGITEDDYQRMVKNQKGRCMICDEKKKLFVDHSHVSGKIRGLLCQTCNTFLGWYENKADIIIQFQRYLDSYN